ncbi:cytochrome-c peroxidase [Polaribacter glomeratus]|uniref:Methylamine utilization protein MauG n=1 Tax=Polaribacter glomeratus TaxID=102 RepID=A0A2S7WHN8_9FLAO|nr:cytochrome c peroxidase [Polaribacter glomeratus]PQJ76792.1 cytochrome-c peroxidase [Polaribacter glomeratus]TXD67368.1 cytochrome-c peroxidase [Polaribacter glomeratus]
MIKKSLFFVCAIFLFLSYNKKEKEEYKDISHLRKLYSQPDASKWPKPHLDSLIDKATFKDIGVLPEVEYPIDNPYSNEKKQLGKTLFFDPRLSKSGQIACASCHNPELGWTDNSTRSFGHDRQTGSRNSMTILNVSHAKELFWDGRASSLEDQARFPIPDKLEMNMDLEYAVDNLKNIEGYKPLFKKAFGDQEITLQKIQYAIATFERTVKSPLTKFDKFITGKSDKFTDQEVLGLHIFRTKARCINCHNTGYFSDNQFHNDGQTLFGTKDEDFGRYNVTGKKEDIGKFRTPTIREVANTKPWMHHGHFPSLLDVVEFYNLGNPAPIQNKYIGIGRDSLLPTTSPLLKKLELNKEEIDAVLAFINTLSTPTRRTIIPTLPQ